MLYKQHIYLAAGSIDLDYPVGGDPLKAKKTACKMVEILMKHFNDRPITLIGRGSSGLILASMIAGMDPNVICIYHVKKEEENSSSHCLSSFPDENS